MLTLPLSRSRRLALALLVAAPLAAPSAQPFVETLTRTAAPFAVRDADGTALPVPFTGGLFEPRPALVDLDADGDADLVLGVGGAGLQHFENTAAPGAAPVWTWRTDRLGLLEPGNWFAFGDLDGDGDLDLLTRGDPGRVRFWRNTGTAQQPAFTLGADQLVDTAGVPVEVEDSSIPDLADVNADGRPDLFAGRADLGHVTLYQHDGTDAGGAPRFALVSREFQGIQVYEPNPSCSPTREGAPGGIVPGDGGLPGGIVPGGAAPGGAGPSPMGRPSVRHGANAIAVADLTGDGAPELFWGDFFSPSLVHFANTGTPTAPVYVRVGDRYPPGQPLTSGGYNAPTFGDADSDGDLDLAVGVQRGLCFDSQSAVENLFYFVNAGTPAAPDFVRQTSRLIHTLDVGTRAAPALVDLDGDGDLDLVVGNETNLQTVAQATLARYLNEGTDAAPAFRLVDADWLGLRYDYGGYAPAFGDLDADGDADLLVGGFNGRFAFLRNTGSAASPQFTLESERFETVDAGQYARVAIGDLDGDGRLDLVTGASNGRVGLYRNVGTPQQPAFVTEANGSPSPPDLAYAAAVGVPADVGEDSAPALFDLDGDGDLDLVIGSAQGALQVFRNTGLPTAPQFVAEAPVPAGRRRTAPAVGDLDGDGRPDLVAGADSGGLLYWGTEASVGTAPTPSGSGGGLGLRLHPNPTSGAVTVAVAAPAEGRVEVFDTVGRRVAEVALSGREAVWDGRHDDGGAVPSGVYFVRVMAGDREQTVALTVAR